MAKFIERERLPPNSTMACVGDHIGGISELFVVDCVLEIDQNRYSSTRVKIWCDSDAYTLF